jgi:hypothetical protein
MSILITIEETYIIVLPPGRVFVLPWKCASDLCSLICALYAVFILVAMYYTCGFCPFY